MATKEEECDFLCKIILFGDSGVGKVDLMRAVGSINTNSKPPHNAYAMPYFAKF